MINSETFIVKRDGKKEAFSLDKIKNAISKAFLSVGSFATQDVITNILSRVSISDGTSVEDIQNQVEVALMAEHYYSVAKAFMLYRQKHLEDREVRDKLRFLMDYCDASNPATGSKYDANANVENKNIATLIGELPKSNFIRLNRRLLTDRLKDMYGKELSDRYIDLLNQHFIYKNDETNLANYCASITMYPWLISGTASIGGNSTAPTNLKSFCGGFINMVFIVSSMLSGACATPEFLMYMNYFIEKEFGEDYYKHPEQLADLSTKQRTIDKIITDCFEQIVYSINQPTGARNFQAVFWNVAYYDQYYFNSLFEHFVFPDGNAPHWESLSWLQKRFMKWFNKERTKAVLTFPVETMALLTKACNKFIHLDLISGEVEDKNAEGIKTAGSGRKQKALAAEDKQDSTVTPISEIEEAIITFVQNNENKGKPTYLGEVGSRLCDKFIEFDARNYGYTKLVTLLKDKCPKLIIIQEGTSYRIELKEQTEPEDLEKEITAFLKRNGGKVDNLSLVLEQLKKKHPNFNLSDYGYSRISSFLRSFDKIAVHGNALMLKDEGRRK
mgnify:CR=1 FL=1